MLFEWKDSLNVLVGVVDHQHQLLFELGSRVHKAMRHGETDLAPLLDNLISYARLHFEHEEQLMAVYHYPHLEAHRHLHGSLVARIVAFRDRFARGDAGVTLDIMLFLHEWLGHHLGKADIDFASFLHERSAA